MNVEFLSYISVLISSLVLLVALLNLYIVYRKQEQRKMDIQSGKILLSVDREKRENRIFSLVEASNDTLPTFKENNGLFLNIVAGIHHIGHDVYNRSFFTKLNIDLDNIKIKEGQVMCLMPFHERYQHLYPIVIDACKDNGFNCVRSDDSYTPDDMLPFIVRMILESQLLIAILNGRNPNVYYEIGLAHALGKPVILVAELKNENNIAFDLQMKGLVLYKAEGELKELLSKSLKDIKK